MLEAARQACVFTRGMTPATFSANEMAVHSVVRMIEIVGEAAAQVTPEYQQAHPQLPWREMVAMRNWLIHAYFDIDVQRVWKTAQEDLPALITQLTAILPPESSS